jgi:uncharacterized protein YcfJ
MNKNMLAVALASLLVGGVAVAAYNSFRSNDNATASEFATANPQAAAGAEGDMAANGAIEGSKLEYADVVNVKELTEKKPLYATVIGTEPVKETSTTSTPREVCEDVVVQERAPERDGNVGGTVAGALIGGLVGNQVGSGNGRKAATVAGAAAGGYIGNRVDRNHVGGKIVERTERKCHTVSSSSTSSKTVAYNVTYRNPDGTTGTMRTGSKPGSRIALGSEDKTIAYDVTYRYDGQERTVRMEDKPGERLPVIDGQVVTQVASATGSNDNG